MTERTTPPDELKERVARICSKEPSSYAHQSRFSQSDPLPEKLTVSSLCGPYKKQLFIALIVVIIGTISANLGPVLVSISIDDGILLGDYSVVVSMCLVYLLAIAVNIVTDRFSIKYLGTLGQNIVHGLRIKVMRHLLRLPNNYYERTQDGKNIAAMTSYIESLSQLFQEGLVNLAAQLLSLIVITVALCILNLKLALILLGFVLPLMFIGTIWFKKHSDKAFGLVRTKTARVIAHFQETIAGMRLVSALNRQSVFRAKHNDELDGHLHANERTAHLISTYMSISEITRFTGQGLIIFVGYKMVLSGQLTTGELIAFVLFLNRFFEPLQALLGLINGLQSARSSITKLRHLLAVVPEVRQAENATELNDITGNIEFKDVSFSYDDDKPVLNHISQKFSAGEVIALVGETGSGKSTFVNLIVRFYDPQSGTILIDGHDIRTATLESLRKQCCLVPQEPFIFSDTVRNNLLFAQPGLSDEALNRALEKLGVAELFNKHKHGLDTACKERGSNLSSGEKQLISFARAYLCDPPLLILDEATSDMDLQSEQTIERALRTLLQGRTSIVIAHRLNTVMRADTIVYIENHEIKERGTHDELLAANGSYAQLIKRWQENEQTQ